MRPQRYMDPSQSRCDVPTSSGVIQYETVQHRPHAGLPRVVTIPSSDLAFGEHVRLLVRRTTGGSADFEARLRRLYPRAIVRDRTLSGEPRTWYVYRDGTWRPSGSDDWWKAPGVPRVAVASDGWVVEANATAAGMLGIDSEQSGLYHFTDFIAPGTLEDSQALFGIVRGGSELNATMLLRPTSGDVVAVDIHAQSDGDELVGFFRLAEDVAFTTGEAPPPGPAVVEWSPRTDVAFKAYVDQAVRRMPEATPGALALRLRRLYPHARVTVEGDRWLAVRDGETERGVAEEWWRDEALPTVRYDQMALIFEANSAAVALLGRELVGHHWQELVTPGSTEEVAVMLEILAEVGAAESRFRMPRADGTMVEFDSYTTVDSDSFTTIIRPIDSGDAAHGSQAHG